MAHLQFDSKNAHPFLIRSPLLYIPQEKYIFGSLQTRSRDMVGNYCHVIKLYITSVCKRT